MTGTSSLAMFSTPYFFETLFNTAINTLGPYITSSIQPVAYSILAVTFLVGVYEAFFRGGSIRDVGVSLVKYVAAALLIANWQGFFSDVTANGLTAIAHSIDSTQMSDIMKNWATQLYTAYSTSGGSLWSLVSADVTTILLLVVSAIGYICYAVGMMLFSLIYTFWGGILYVIGPMLVALMPSLSVGQYAKTYLSRFVEWAAWPILYAIFGNLLVAINMNSVNTIVSSLSFTDVITNSTSVLYIGLVSILYAFCLLLIPFIAHALIKGEFVGVGGAIMAAGYKAARVMSGDMAGAAADTGRTAPSSTGGGGEGSATPIAAGHGEGAAPVNTQPREAGYPAGYGAAW